MSAVELSLPAMMDSSSSGDADSDQGLLRRYFAQQDQAAMEQLFVRHAAIAYRIALRELGNAADAEEAVQSAFVKVLTKGDQNVSNVRGWIMGIVVNDCRDRIRGEVRRRARQEATAPELTVEQPVNVEQAELLTASLKLVKALPEHYRLPVSLHLLDGLSFKEIALTLALPEPTVRRQTSRGIEQLRQALAAAGFAAGIAGITDLLASSAPTSAPATLTATFKTMIAGATVKTTAAATTAGAAKSAGAVFAPKVLIAATLSLAVAVAVVVSLKSSGANRSTPQSAVQPVAPAAPVLPESLAAKLEHTVDFGFKNAAIANALTDIGRKLEITLKLTPAAEAQAGDQRVNFSVSQVTGREALKQLAKSAGLKLENRATEVVLDTLPEAPPPPDMAPGIGNLLQIVEIKFEKLDAKTVAQKLSAAYNVNIYFSDVALAALKDQTLDLDEKDINGIEVLGRLAERSNTELQVQDGAVFLCRRGEPQAVHSPPRPVKPPHEDF